MVRRATKRLAWLHAEEYHTLLGEELHRRGTDNRVRELPPPADELGGWALEVGYPDLEPVTERVRRLLDADGDMFDRIVGDDVTRRSPEPDLGHPLVLARWETVLDRLARDRMDLLRIPWRPDATVSDVDLVTAGLDEHQAYERINLFRFLVHVRQRWMEKKILTRRFHTAVVAWRTEVTTTARAAARAQLRDRHESEYRELLAAAAVEPRPDRPERQAPPPQAVVPPSRPQRVASLVDRLRDAGWVAIVEDVPGPPMQVYVTASRGTPRARLRAAFRRGRNGSGTGHSWDLRFAGIRLDGAPDWTRLPGMAELVELAAVDHAHLAEIAAKFATPAQYGSIAAGRGGRRRQHHS
ncbi:hypothetical protein Lfu02_77730 [Longispora fulva]|uniref:Uncharacterized protein n=1 Tax=Longispora fulva TaxID=619741 RepID=A0A8J7GGF2_9ACTN|nr:hypothetical protein [Longispora fulva]MBG6136222.1 hypothetical protein [Longispora fulva]GIG63401.1 hypothetical protein Lfu02_77730 [Longispora fulva]